MLHNNSNAIGNLWIIVPKYNVCSDALCDPLMVSFDHQTETLIPLS